MSPNVGSLAAMMVLATALAGCADEPIASPAPSAPALATAGPLLLDNPYSVIAALYERTGSLCDAPTEENEPAGAERRMTCKRLGNPVVVSTYANVEQLQAYLAGSAQQELLAQDRLIAAGETWTVVSADERYTREAATALGGKVYTMEGISPGKVSITACRAGVALDITGEVEPDRARPVATLAAQSPDKPMAAAGREILHGLSVMETNGSRAELGDAWVAFFGVCIELFGDGWK
jgi:hypothetical protein